MRTLALLVLALFVGMAPATAQHHSHVHGVARMMVTGDGDSLVIRLEAPLEALLGFEHAAHTAAERKAVDAMRRRLDGDRGLVKPNASAQCAHVRTTLIDDGQGQAGSEQASGSTAQRHADLEAEFMFRCARPSDLREIDVGLFEAFARLRRIQASFATAAGQGQRELKKPQRKLSLAR